MLLNVETCKPLQSSVTTIHLPEITCCCFAFLLQTPGCEKYSTKNKLTYLPRFQMQRMTIKPTICPLWQETGQSSSHLQCTPSTVWSSRASKTQVLHHWLQHHMHFHNGSWSPTGQACHYYWDNYQTTTRATIPEEQDISPLLQKPSKHTA